MKIGILSDTHGIWRPQIERCFEGVELILHAGDVGRVDILENLSAIAPVSAVRGNVDDYAEAAYLPAEIETEIEGIRFLLRHVGCNVGAAPGDLKALLQLRGIGVFLFGHSHKTYSEYLDSTLFFNPGAAGPRRFSLPLTVATMEIEAGRLSWKFWELAH